MISLDCYSIYDLTELYCYELLLSTENLWKENISDTFIIGKMNNKYYMLFNKRHTTATTCNFVYEIQTIGSTLDKNKSDIIFPGTIQVSASLIGEYSMGLKFNFDKIITVTKRLLTDEEIDLISSKSM
ncbi:MAG: hypothetical protein ACLS2V_12885 [Clostridium paraputrificum]|uniref:hypothetical protein n=1 Tax=Clostridium sp. TaxID=1506 RepID=UPI0025C316BB|nr:hypothetical protein [Clostridium sp.]MBS5926235.1 hypothetical protein [Clostridium sp.]